MMSTNERHLGLLQMISAMIMMGTVGYFVLESGQKPHEVVFYRCLFGAILLFLYCFLTGMLKNTGLNYRKLIFLVLSGIFLIVNWIALFASFDLASIAVTTTIYHFQPFIFLIIWAFLSKESIAKEKYFWMALAFAGVVFVSDLNFSNLELTSSYVYGLLLAILAAFFWAISAVLVKKITDVKPHLVVLIQMIVGALILFPFLEISSTTNINENQWIYLFILGLVHTCLTYILMYSSYQKLNATSIAILTFIYPVIAIIVDYIFYENMLNKNQIIGVILILLSSFASSQNFNPFKSKKEINVKS